MRLFPILLLLAFLAAPAAAQESYLLRNRYEGAQSWILTWKLTSTIHTSGNEIPLEAEGREKVTFRALGGDRFLYRAVGERCVIESREPLKASQISMLGEGDVFEAEIDGCGRTLKTLRKPDLARDYAFLFVLPDAPMRPGTPWRSKDTVQIPVLGALDLDTTLDLVDAQGDDLRLQGRSLMRWRADRREGRTESKLTYDLKSGVLKRGRLRTSLDVEVKGVKLAQSLFFNWDVRPDLPAPGSAADGW